MKALDITSKPKTANSASERAKLVTMSEEEAKQYAMKAKGAADLQKMSHRAYLAVYYKYPHLKQYLKLNRGANKVSHDRLNEIREYCILNPAEALSKARNAAALCKDEREMEIKFPEEMRIFQILDTGYWKNRSREKKILRQERIAQEKRERQQRIKEREKQARNRRIEQEKAKAERLLKKQQSVSLEAKIKWLRTDYKKSAILFVQRCNEVLDSGVFLTDKIIRNLQSNADISQDVKYDIVQRSDMIKARLTREKTEQYISNGHSANTGRLKWTEEACLAKAKELIAQGKGTQDFRKEARRAYEVVYEKYRYMLKMFPSYQTLEERRTDHGKSQSRGKYKEVRKVLLAFEGVKEEFDAAHGEWLEYINSTPSLKKSYEGHFRCRPRKETLSQIQRKIPGFGVVDEKGMYRAIYVYWYDGDDRVGKIAYVGLAKDLAIRDRDHNGISRIHKDKVSYYKHVLGIQWNYKVLTDFLPEQEAQQAEAYWERHYRNLGYEMLNAAPCGSLGGSGFKNVKLS